MDFPPEPFDDSYAVTKSTTCDFLRPNKKASELTNSVVACHVGDVSDVRGGVAAAVVMPGVLPGAGEGEETLHSPRHGAHGRKVRLREMCEASAVGTTSLSLFQTWQHPGHRGRRVVPRVLDRVARGVRTGEGAKWAKLPEKSHPSSPYSCRLPVFGSAPSSAPASPQPSSSGKCRSCLTGQVGTSMKVLTRSQQNVSRGLRLRSFRATLLVLCELATTAVRIRTRTRLGSTSARTKVAGLSSPSRT